MVRKAMLIWCNVERLQSSSQEGLCFNKFVSSTTIFYCPAFQNVSWSALAAKLWRQPTFFFASLSPFCLFTLVHTIFKLHPMELESRLKSYIVAGGKIAKCVRSDLWRKSLATLAGDQIRRDRLIKSPSVSSAQDASIKQMCYAF